MSPNNSIWKSNSSNVNDASAKPVQNRQNVECQLKRTYGKLAGTEADIHLFTTLKGMNLATNDIMNFVKKTD